MGALNDIVMKLVVQGMNPAEAQRVASQSLGAIENEIKASMARQVEAHRKAAEAQTATEKKESKEQVREATKKTQELMKAFKAVEKEAEKAAKGTSVHWRRTLEDMENISTIFLALKSSIGGAISLVSGLAKGSAAAANEAERIGHVYGSRGGQELNAIRALAGNGVNISGFDLARARNKQLIGELELSQKQFADLAAAADDLGDALGVDAAGALDSMITALETGRTKTLAAMGVIVDADSAVADFAATHGKFVSELTDSEKKLAVQEEMLAKIGAAAEKASGKTGDFKDEWGRLKTELSDAYDEQLAAIGNSEKLGEAMRTLWEATKASGEWLGNWTYALTNPMGGLTQLTDSINAQAAAFENLRRKALDAQRVIDNDKRGKADGLAAYDGEMVQGDSVSVWYQKQMLLSDTTLKRSKAASKTRAGNSEPTGVDRMIADMLAAREEASRSADIGRRYREDQTADTEHLFSQIAPYSGTTDQERLLGYDSAAASDGAAQAGAAQAKALKAEIENLRGIAGNGIMADLIYGPEGGREKFLSDIELAKQKTAEMADFVGNAGAQMATALGAELSAALAGEKSFSAAIRDATRNTLKMLSQESIVRALFESAKGFAALAMGSPGAALHFKSAAMFGAVGVAAGLGARAIGGGTSASGGTSSVPTSRRTNEFSGSSGSRSSDSDQSRPINLYVYVPPGGNAESGRQVVKAIQEYEASTGKKFLGARQ